MTYTELCRVCGKPRSIKYDYVNYGKIWIKMSDFVDRNPIIVKGGYVTDPSNLSSVNNIIKQ
ncbi:MAG TPA: hypothetical protein PKY37_04000 [Paludibacteraceae bacterium]|nr:hypothetical protein [Paludibacteraceae bacterium]